MLQDGPFRCIAILFAALTLASSPLAAQRGFFFGHPGGQISIHAGPMMHTAGGDLFDFFQAELTLERSDFRTVAVAGELLLFAHPRFDLGVGLGWSEASARSEFREFTDSEDLPIEQTTRLRVVPLMAELRVYPIKRGRRISSLAWIPARTVPYVGGGAGISFYRLQQVGDFVGDEIEEDVFEIFTDDFVSSAVVPTGHVLVGVDHWLSRRFAINAEGRYSIGWAKPKGDFVNWDRLDLSGLLVSVGFSYRW